jgi:hypothetical protein
MTPYAQQPKTSLKEELKLIHPAGWGLAGVVLLLWLAIALPTITGLIMRESNPPPISFFIILLTLAAFVMSAAVLLVFYVNVDAKRRGMNRLLWTLLVIFVPNGIGFIVYFVLRKPIALACPKCSATVNADYSYCPACQTELAKTCPACHHGVKPDWLNCAYCGKTLEA